MNALGRLGMLIYRGLGQSGGQIISAGGAVAGSTAGILALPAIGVLPAFAGPIGIAIAGIASLLAVVGVGSGCGQSCIQASNDANSIESAMKANLQAFLSGQISQSQALQNFQTLWSQLQQACAQVGGTAGQHCVSDRQQGACSYQTSPGGWSSDGTYTPPGPNGSGSSCWNWFVGYADPISQAPASASVGSSVLSGFPSWLPWALGGGLLLWGATS